MYLAFFTLRDDGMKYKDIMAYKTANVTTIVLRQTLRWCFLSRLVTLVKLSTISWVVKINF